MYSTQRMRMLVAGIIGGFMVMMAGCGTTTPIPITKTNNVIITPAKSTLVHVIPQAPPDKVAFIAADQDTRLEMLRKDDADLRTLIKNVNDRLDSIQEWVDKEVALYQNVPNTTWAGQAPAGVAASTPAAQ